MKVLIGAIFFCLIPISQTALIEYILSDDAKCMKEKMGDIELRHTKVGFQDYVQISSKGKTMSDCLLFISGRSRMVVEIGEPWKSTANTAMLKFYSRLTVWEEWKYDFNISNSNSPKRGSILDLHRSIKVEFINPDEADVTVKLAIRPKVGLPVAIPKGLLFTTILVVVGLLVAGALLVRCFCPDPNKKRRISGKRCPAWCCCKSKSNGPKNEAEPNGETDGFVVKVNEEVVASLQGVDGEGDDHSNGESDREDDR